MNWLDSHCHIDAEEFTADRNAVLHAASLRGVSTLVLPGVSVEQWNSARRLCESMPGLYFSAGLHPQTVTQFYESRSLKKSEFSLALSSLQEALSHRKCVALGECGLDKRFPEWMLEQTHIFMAQLDIAESLQMPVMLHSVRAHSEVLELLKRRKLTAGGVVHAFTGSYDLARAYWKLGFYIGIGGSISYERAKKTQDAVQRMPLESMLLETDAPDMPLAGRQGQRNSPEYIPLVAECLAVLKKVSLEDVAEITTRNAQALFRIKADV